MEYLAIGKIKKPHGLLGELKVTIDERYFADVNEVEAFFIPLQGEHAPYFIESIRGKGPFLLKLEDIDTKEDASIFTNKKIYLRREDISLSEEEINADGLAYGFLTGFTLHDQELGEIGKLLQIEEFPHQEMATVSYEGNEVFVPLLEGWILEIDEENKMVQMDLPEGLLNIG